MSARLTGNAAKSTGKNTGCYLYAIIGPDPLPELGSIGIDGAPVYCVAEGAFQAVVSDIPNEKLRPERRKLGAHHEVQKKLLASGLTVLPVSFGLVAESPKALSTMLGSYRSDLKEQYKRVSGKVEMGLHVLWDVPNIFEFFVKTHPDLHMLRDQMFRGGREPNHDAKIELGRMFDRLLAEERSRISEQITDTLKNHSFEFKENKPRNEKEVVNLAFLIGRDGQKEFEQGIFEVANQFDHNYAFDFNGPWPPHNFVDLSIAIK